VSGCWCFLSLLLVLGVRVCRGFVLRCCCVLGRSCVWCWSGFLALFLRVVCFPVSCVFRFAFFWGVSCRISLVGGVFLLLSSGSFVCWCRFERFVLRSAGVVSLCALCLFFVFWLWGGVCLVGMFLFLGVSGGVGSVRWAVVLLGLGLLWLCWLLPLWLVCVRVVFLFSFFFCAVFWA